MTRHPRSRSVATIVLAAILGVGGVGCETPDAGSESTRDVPVSIVLISIDTARADRLGSYGHGAAETPVLDRLAAGGVRFSRAFSPVPVTLPAHATLLTGRWPHHHGIRDNGLHRLPDDVPTLAGTLRAAGHDTAAVVAAAVLDRQYGLDRGFDRYDDRTPPGGGLTIPERPAAEVTDAALAAAAELGPRYFLFVHYFDPHADYRPPPPFRQRHAASPYDGELAYVDREIGRLLDGLRTAGRLDDAVVVVTADHGESLGEHGEATHGVFLYQSTLHVPLIVAGPAVDGGRVVDAPASLADVTPTLLDLAGLSAPPGLDGRSLAEAVRGRAGPARADAVVPLESEHGFNSYGWAPLRGATDGRFKWIDAPRPELYDLAVDPDEAVNRYAELPADVDRLRRARAAATVDDVRAPAPGGDTDAEIAARLEQLESLGYVHGGGGGDRDDLPDPKEVIGTLDDVNRARADLSAGRLDRAERTLSDVVARSPRNVSALTLLGSVRILAGRHGDALRPLAEAERLAPYEADVPFNRGLARAGLGDAEGAASAWRRTLELAPRHVEAAANLIDLSIRRGDADEAARVLADAREAGLEGGVFDYFEGRLAFDRGDPRRASVALQRAVAAGIPPGLDAEARAMLGAIARAGR